jgi:putative ABC transport system ATP-binding protein
MIEARALVKEYDAGGLFRAVDDVSLDIKRGEVVLIIGPNGSGKTTLLSILGGLVKPTSGQVSVDRHVLDTMSERERESFRLRRVGFVFQQFRLIDALTVRENVQLVIDLAGETHSADPFLERTGVLHLGERRTNVLSGGEKQRVALARALANDPSILLADEPTGSLDSAAGEATIAMLCDAARSDGRTVVIVSHDARIVPHADRVVKMLDGRVH